MRFAFLLLLLSLVDAAPLAAQERILEDPEKVLVWLKSNRVPALALGVIRDGKLTQVRVYGELQDGVTAPHDAIFNVASLTKPIVSMLTLQLVHKGQWQLDEPLARYWIDPDVRDDPRHAKLTTRHVLSHQTGFMNWRSMEESKKLAFHWEPGTQLRYSGEGFEYLAKALEKKFGRTLPQLAAEHIFRPLRMHDTQFQWTATTDAARFARWHDAEGRKHPNDYKITTVSAADNVLTTVEDYGRFAAWVMSGAGLSDALHKDMVKAHATVRTNVAMGLGWELLQNLSGGEYALVHTGSDPGVQTLVVLLPKSRSGLIAFMNGDNGSKLYERLIVESFTVGVEMMARAKGN